MNDDAGLGFLLLIVLALIYFIPTIVATSKSHANTGALFALNFFLGWTLVGWVAALVWALSNPAAVTIAAQAQASEGDSPSQTTDALDRLERLVKLKTDGHLTDAEFAAQKAQLLGGANPAPPAAPAPRPIPRATVIPMAAEHTDHHDADNDIHARLITQSIGIGDCAIETNIKYHDAHGGETFRPITIKQVRADADGHVYLESYCRLRKMARTFRADRIECFANGDGVITATRDFLVRDLRVPLLIGKLTAATPIQK